MAEWFVRWTTKPAYRVLPQVAAGIQCWMVTLPGTVSGSSIGLDWIIREVMACTVGSAGNKLFHPHQVVTFVDYPR